MERQQLLPVDDEPGSDPGVLLDISLNSTVITNLFSNLAISNWHCTIFLHFRVCTDIFRKWVQIDEKNHLSNLYFWRKENYLDKI